MPPIGGPAFRFLLRPAVMFTLALKPVPEHEARMPRTGRLAS